MHRLRLAVSAALIAAVLVPISVYASDPIDYVSAFFDAIQVGDVSGAVDRVFEGSPVPPQKPQEIEFLKKQTSARLPMYGKYIGYELIRQEEIGTAIYRIVCVSKHDMAPLVWEFYFYKPKDVWFLDNMKFNDQFQSLHKIQ